MVVGSLGHGALGPPHVCMYSEPMGPTVVPHTEQKLARPPRSGHYPGMRLEPSASSFMCISTWGSWSPFPEQAGLKENWPPLHPALDRLCSDQARR